MQRKSTINLKQNKDKKSTKKKQEKKVKDDRMIADYFRELKKYYEKYGEATILLWQCGSFYEVYAVEHPETKERLLSRIDDYLEITHMNCANKNLTYEHDGIKMPVKMAGFTAEDYYLTKYSTILVNEGFTVAVWHENGYIGKKKTRKELHVFSPGTNFNVHEKKEETNTIACYVVTKHDKGFMKKNPSIYFGCAAIDIFTGNTKLFQYSITSSNIHNHNVFDELERFNSIYNPSETIIIHNYSDEKKINDIIQFAGLQTKSIHIISELIDSEQSRMVEKCEQQAYQKSILTDFYDDINDYDSFIDSSSLSRNPIAYKSFCFLLDFIFQHNPNLTHKLNHPTFDNINNRLVLANHSLRQLNIVNPHNVKGQFSSIERMINKCVTPMGRRNFRDIILHPVNDIPYLKRQYKIVDYVMSNYEKFEFMRKKLKTIRDFEHLYRKIIFNKISPSDLWSFNQNLYTIIEINKILENDKVMKNYIKKNIGEDIQKVCTKLINVLERNLNMSICQELTQNKFEINFFNENINNLLDEVSRNFNEVELQKTKWISDLGSLIKDRDPIKVHFTEKNGMYFYATDKRCTALKIALEKKTKETIPEIKFVGGGISGNKKLMGDTLKQFYNSYIQKQDDLVKVLKTVYLDFIISLREYNHEMNRFVKYVSELDILVTKAYVSKRYNYCRPQIKEKAEKSFIVAKNIRHPLIENIQINETYVPNDISIGKKFDGMLIYGTNGVGKSSINRSVGIAVIMAQAGMFVPCSKFQYKPYSAIYTRILGNDNIFKGQSTFNVEMCEMATIVNLCDENSLVLGDEVCSGTETASAVSIFVETLRYLNKKHASHIFATHFHQITQYKEITDLSSLTIKHMSVRCDSNGVLYYTRKLEDGPGADMYGLEVCKSFDFPKDFLDGAYNIRKKYFNNSSQLERKKSRYNSKKIKGKCEFCNKEGVDIHHLLPQEKADVNNYISTIHKNHPANLTNVCKTCHNYFTVNKTVHKKVKTTTGYILMEQ